MAVAPPVGSLVARGMHSHLHGGRTYDPWFLWPMFGWGIGIAGHVISDLLGPGSPGEERAVARELRRLRTPTHT